MYGSDWAPGCPRGLFSHQTPYLFGSLFLVVNLDYDPAVPVVVQCKGDSLGSRT